MIGDTELTREFERMIAALAPTETSGVNDALRALDAPTLLVWGTADSSFGVKWAYQLRDTIPSASVNEVDGAKIFFPDERPGDLIPHLRKLWGR